MDTYTHLEISGYSETPEAAVHPVWAHYITTASQPKPSQKSKHLADVKPHGCSVLSPCPCLPKTSLHLHPHTICGWYKVKGTHQMVPLHSGNILTSWKIYPSGLARGLTELNVHEAWKKRSPLLPCVACMRQHCKLFKVSHLPACIS